MGAELLFQVISVRAERATLIIMTNLPFSDKLLILLQPYARAQMSDNNSAWASTVFVASSAKSGG